MASDGQQFGMLELERADERFEPETPFLDTRFASEAWQERETFSSYAQQPFASSGELETPFVSEYQGEAPVNLEHLAIEQALTSLHDRDFNEAVSNLALEAAAQAEHFAQTSGEAAVSQLLGEWLDPLRLATEQLFVQAGETAMQQPLLEMSEADFENLFETAAPAPGTVAPEFEDFFKKVWSKIKKVGGTLLKAGLNVGGALMKLSPVGLILKKLARLVRPLLAKVIRFAVGKLPAELRPMALRLGRKLGILREAGFYEAEEETEVATSAETDSIARDFDISVATLMFAQDEVQAEEFLGEAQQEMPAEAETNVISELDAARERFVSQFSQLQSGESAAPVVQQFIPAILPVLRIGIRLVGRQRVVNFLAGYLARLIQKYVGPSAATSLSRALVSVGLRMVTLEAEAPQAEAARAVAATLEDTVRRMASFGFEQFDNLDSDREQQQLFEAVTNEAFFEAAMAHFPSELLDTQRLQEREMHFETAGQPGSWVYRPRPRYKKYTRVFEVDLTPQIAKQILSFGNQQLSAFLRARNVKLPAKVRVHLYEAIPGTILSQIAYLEKKVPGLGSGREEAWSKIHPLTKQTAGLLLREPDLGRDMEPRWMESRNRIGVGQRFFYIEIAASGPGGPCNLPSQVNITIDLPASQIRINAYLSEADAQKVVATGPVVAPTTAVVLLMGMASGAIRSLREGRSKHVNILREATGELEGEEFLPAGMVGAVASKIKDKLIEMLIDALMKLIRAAIIWYLNNRFDAFKTATRNPACGVTIVFKFNHPGLRVLHVVLAGRVPGMSDVRAALKAAVLPGLHEITPGFRRV